MPFYVYRCKQCQEAFEEEHHMDERELPLQEKCPFCNVGELYIEIQAAGLSFRGMPHKVVPEWFKDRLKRIAKRTPGNKINIP